MRILCILGLATTVFVVTEPVSSKVLENVKIPEIRQPETGEENIQSAGQTKNVKRSSKSLVDGIVFDGDQEGRIVKRGTRDGETGRGRPRRPRPTRPSRPTPSTPSYETIESGQIIRLRGGTTSLAGRVEVFLGSRWGTVCDDAWNVEDAHVVCRQLGYDRGAEEATVGGVFGQGQGEILMDNVQCFGFESSLQSCSHIPAAGHDCSVSETAGVICLPNEGCEDGWFGANGVCYKFVENPTNFRQATKMCISFQARLAIIESQKENDFLSEWLKTNTVMGPWFIGGKRKGGIRNAKWNWVRSYRPDMKFSKWLPGAGLARNKKCLVMQDRVAGENGVEYELDYFYWDSASCNKPLPFICQKVAVSSDCYEGNGENYRGRVSRTEDGTLCENWSNATDINPTTHPFAGLGDHNFCRNPDSDQRPWCYVSVEKRKYLYCAVQPCSSSA
ncbi:uncharacterized protein LOC106176828 isoform X2 [Lingula anatina]|uniref:Uncharacterized protein LOC106176828 isoform X1 n=1 Tax=Lingula anatina TaxID=7574 RepID=A0A1S3JWY8_LINAN|nr:uncharacterized protein LOC106176828 isoform X1 [Lingula anatina]XP_013414822.1 uncharacterized protein LOC106176828 isoform X2 [Lingula anatina]|eukprot:XP_013414821.1 uncharacterized protein LOC106176828 isoform X1 [Lingula anatina]